MKLQNKTYCSPEAFLKTSRNLETIFSWFSYDYSKIADAEEF